MGCNCKSKKTQASEASQTQALAENRRAQLREARAKAQSLENAKKTA